MTADFKPANFPINWNTSEASVELARITAGGQTTIPSPIREAADLQEGDIIAFELEGDHLLLHKVILEEDGYLKEITTIFGEWASPEDEEAWHDV